MNFRPLCTESTMEGSCSENCDCRKCAVKLEIKRQDNWVPGRVPNLTRHQWECIGKVTKFLFDMKVDEIVTFHCNRTNSNVTLTAHTKYFQFSTQVDGRELFIVSRSVMFGED